jgi:pilus assembly protein CpaB
MGKWKAIFPIIVALIIGAAGSYLLYRWVKTQSTPREAVEVTTTVVPVVVAKSDLVWGTKITQEMITTASFLKESLPVGYYSKSEDVVGQVLIAILKTNEPVTEARLASKDITIGGVSAVLPNGMRAIAVAGDKVSGISGFIKPGNIVDVLVTIEDPTTKKQITKLVLEKVPVLATGSQIQENAKGEPSPVDVYTLEVTPEDAEKLALVSTEGRLQFALRNITDQDTILTKGATIEETLSALRESASKTKKTTTSKAAVNTQPRQTAVRQVTERVVTVQEIRGDVVTEKKFTE